MRRPLLTVLTTPVPGTVTRLYRNLRRAARPLVKPLAPPFVAPAYHGHRSLVRSVVTGLAEIGADFNVNPQRVGDLGAVVYAPANEALAQAIALKRQGHVARVVAGPVNAFVPSECGGILLSPEIDIVIVASAWVRDFYRAEAPTLDPRVRVCPAGVDVRYWAPASRPAGLATGRRAVVYEKGVSDALCRASNDLIEQLGIEVTRVKYGAYDAAGFKAALSDATVAVFLSPFETQGLALAEAWAMNVPTLAWDPQDATEWKGHSFVAGSSCPYLTPATGRAWRTLPELDAALRATLASPAYTPRDWALAHMTDAICSEALYRIVRDAAPPS